MHQPRAITDKEGMGIGHGQIIHHLVGGFKHHGLDYAGCAIGLLDVVTGRSPAALPFPGGKPGRGCHRVERVRWRGFDGFAINRQVNDDRVGVCQRGGDGIVASGVGFLIPRQHAVTHIDFADGNSAILGNDRCFRVKATGTADESGHIITLVNERVYSVDTVAYIAATNAGNGDHANE